MRRARRGYLILAALVLAAVLIFNVDAVVDLGRDRLELVALVPGAEGVRIGSAVWVAGVESGRVTHVGFAGRGAAAGTGQDSLTVAVHVELDPETRHVITRSSDVGTRRVRFIAEPIVQIDVGAPGDPPVRDGDTLRGSVRPDPMALLEQAAEFPDGLDSLVHAVQRIQRLADDRAPEIRRLTRQLATTTTAAAALSAEMEGGSLQRMLDPEVGLPGRLADLQARLGQLREAADLVTSRYAPGSAEGAGTNPDGLPAAVQGLVTRVEDVDRQLATLQERLAAGRGFLPRAQQDSALQVAIRGVQAQIDSLTSEAVSIGLRMLLP